ncbi:hypothetical protein EV278_1103 [Caulobacter sp. BK020]|nr:hypothetical protein EV278_1103 [Caulobacter sp. BK020]
MEARKINALDFLDPGLSSSLQTTAILVPPEGTGRARGQRPMRLSGVDERGLSAAREFAVGGLKQRARDVSSPIGTFMLGRSRPSWGSLRSSKGSLPPLKSCGAQIHEETPGGVKGGKGPRAPALRITAPREAPDFVETVHITANHPGEARALRTLPIPSQPRRVSVKPRLRKTPPSAEFILRPAKGRSGGPTAPPEGQQLVQRRSSPLGEVAPKGTEGEARRWRPRLRRDQWRESPTPGTRAG